MQKVNLKDPRFYFNRELSWLRFNERVLQEAEDDIHPLLERLKFLSIFSNNLDEFFMIRVAGLKEQINAQIYTRSTDGLAPAEQLQRITEQLRPLVKRQSDCLRDVILPKLEAAHVSIKRYPELSEEQRNEVREYFHASVFPLLTPLGIDNSHPFPKIRGLDLNLLVELKVPFNDEETRLAVVPIPKVIPRFYSFTAGSPKAFIPVGAIVEANLDALFPNMTVLNASMFRVTRNADLDISEAEADDLLKLIERELRKRRLGTIVRLEVSSRFPRQHVEFLAESMGLISQDIYTIDTYLGLNSFMQLLGQVHTPALKDSLFTPAPHPKIAEAQEVYKAVRQNDILLHHPYDNFQPVVDFVEWASLDPQVVTIKMTLYRTTDNSPIVAALKEAAQNGKQVTVLVELKARFDEKNNITWAKELEQVGAHVAYGVVGLKTHSKMCLVLRREGNHIRSYLHLSTGNYNERTANIYTDLGLFTCDPDIGRDAAEVFNLLTGYSKQEQWRKMLVAPFTMREEFKRLIAKCINAQTPEQPSRIRLVMNSMSDPEMIRALYQASMAGVRVQCIVRGVCCLVPGLQGVSDNISVVSLVGRFLEHTRIFCFEYDGNIEIFSGSADWMTRNLSRRIEVIYPIESEPLRNQILEILEIQFQDNYMARILQPDGTYSKLRECLNGEPYISQNIFLHKAMQRQHHVDTTQLSVKPPAD